MCTETGLFGFANRPIFIAYRFQRTLHIFTGSFISDAHLKLKVSSGSSKLGQIVLVTSHRVDLKRLLGSSVI